MQWLRRCCQGLCLALFLWLVLVTALGERGYSARLLRLFFDLDPLVFLATAISARSLAAASFLCLITIVATVLLGRVFCGWVCPLGAAHNLASWFRTRRKPRDPESRSPWQRLKYGILIALLLMAVFGMHWIGVFDPITLFYRSAATAVWPGAQYAVEDASTAIYHADPHLGPLRVTTLTEPVYRSLRDNVFMVKRQRFLGGTAIALIFIVIVGLNLVRPRFWCRYLCPLGGLLGLLAQWPLLRLRNHPDTCTNCGLCNVACPAAAQPDQRGNWLPTECYGCWNCVATCRNGSIDFHFEAPWQKPDAGKIDYSRRATLAAGVGGMASMLAMRVPLTPDAKPFVPSLIRPPGARAEREFLQRCLQCGLCMRACPTNALQPTAFEAGLEGIWTPRLVPKIGYCEYNCTQCGQVCPTEAIVPLPVEEKQQVKIGLATVDRSRCLPYAYGRECLVCEEHCPLSPKAIFLVEEETVGPDGDWTWVKQPIVDPDLCIGCGVCEWSCVFQDVAAIRVTSANESRHPANQPILPGLGGGGRRQMRRRGGRGRGEWSGDDDGVAAPARENNPYGL